MTTTDRGAGWLLLRNARAGAADREVVDGLATRLPGAEVVGSSSPDDVDDALGRLDGRALVVCGGDGSIHLAVQRARDLGLLDDVLFGLVPLGTGNDLAGHLGIPDDDPMAALEVLRTARPRTCDLLVDDDGAVVVNAAHAGVGVDAAQRASALKDRLGALAYPLGAMVAGARAEGLDVRVEVDGQVVDEGEPVLMVIIGNGHSIGGGAPAEPVARIDDGLLDVVVSHAVGPAARVAYGLAMTRGRHLERDDVVHVQGRSVRISGTPLAWNVDGELGDPIPGRRLTVEPAAWRVLAPSAR